MACPHRTRVPFVSLLILALLTIAPTPSAAEWRRLDSPNFVIVGDVGAGALRDIAVKFEGFRETLSRVLSDRVTSTAVPTVVIVFTSDKAFTPYKPKYQGKAVDVSGLFLAGQDVNYIALLAGGDEEAMRVVFHEYAHLIISNIGRNIPVWLNEGLAEYYSTYQSRAGGREATLGMAIASHLLQLNEGTPLPLAQLLAATHESPMYNEGARRSVFYAQSWALTHMLHLGQPPRRPLLGQFLSLVGQGVPAMDAWTTVFSADPVEKDLKNYIRRRVFGAYRYTFPEKLATFDAAAAPLARADADAFLADFLIQQGRHDEATQRLGPASPGGAETAWPSTVRAGLDVAKTEYAGAEKRLLALPENVDWLTGYRAGAALSNLVARGVDKPADAHLTAAQKLFGVARSEGREIPNAVARLATLELAVHDRPDPATAAALEHARTLAPGRVDYAFLHARVLVAQAAYLPARNIVAPLMSPVYPQDIRDSARSLMGYIVRLEAAMTMPAGPGPLAAPSSASEAPSRAAQAAQTASEGTPTGPGAQGNGRSLPDAGTPIYRDRAPGEHRLEGILDRIACATDGAGFHVRTTEGPARLTAPRMDVVEFITYRDDLKGNVSCGPLKEPARVYVTWRQGADGARTVVAIEFLPK